MGIFEFFDKPPTTKKIYDMGETRAAAASVSCCSPEFDSAAARADPVTWSLDSEDLGLDEFWEAVFGPDFEPQI